MVTFLISKLMLQLGLKLHLRLSCLFSVRSFFTTEDKKKTKNNPKNKKLKVFDWVKF